MSAAAIRAAIVAVIEGVTDIGRVHDRPRYAKGQRDLVEHYYSEDHHQIRGWHVKRRTMAEIDPLTGAHGVEITGWEITGFLALDDDEATELTLDALVEALRTAFKANRTLTATVDDISANEEGKAVGLQLEDSDYVSFGGVLCHRAKCALYTTRIV